MRFQMKDAVFAILFSVALQGCNLNNIDPGGGASTKSTVRLLRDDQSVEEVVSPATNNSDQVAGSENALGSISGVVKLEGPIPTLAPKVAKGSSPADKTVCAVKADIVDDSLLVGSDSGIANVFIYLDKTPKGWKPDDSMENSPVDQKDCIFIPHAALIRSGRKTIFRNSEMEAAHNVQTFPSINSGTNDNLKAQSEMQLEFKKPEPKPFQAKCAIHAWMSFWILVKDHPFMVLTDADGKFEMKNLPAGKHKFTVFHERADVLQKVELDVKSGQDSKLELKYSSDRFLLKQK